MELKLIYTVVTLFGLLSSVQADVSKSKHNQLDQSTIGYIFVASFLVLPVTLCSTLISIIILYNIYNKMIHKINSVCAHTLLTSCINM